MKSENKSKKGFRSEAATTPKVVPLAGGGAASLLACICMFGVCHAHAKYRCVCSLAAVVTKSISDSKQYNQFRSALEDVWCKFHCHLDMLSPKKESKELYSYNHNASTLHSITHSRLARLL